MSSPGFYIIGAPKSGAEIVRDWLSTHPGIHLPDQGGENFHATDLVDRLSDQNLYQQRFAPRRDSRTGLEFSNWYLYSDQAVPSILAQNPGARFVVCLNDPACIAWQLHRDYLTSGIEHVRDFGTAWAMSFARSQNRGVRGTHDAKLLDYAAICALGTQFTRLLCNVPESQVHVLLQEDLLADPAGCWQGLQEFLGLSPVLREDFAGIDRRIDFPRRRLPILTAPLATKGRRLMAGIMGAAGLSSLAQSPILKPAAPPREALQRVSDRLAEDIATLSVMTGRDLMHWVH